MERVGRKACLVPVGWTARALTLSALAIALTGCSIPCLRRGQPAAPLPETFNGQLSTDSSAQLSVDEFYQDPQLSQLIAQALANNQELKILEEEIQVARAEVLGRQGAFLPFVTLGGESEVGRFSLFTPAGAAEEQLLDADGDRFPSPLGNHRLGLNLFWRIDIWREFRNARDAARQRYVAAVEERNYFVTELVAEIAEKYYELMALDQRLINLDRVIGLQTQSLKAAEANKAAGRSTELAVRRFEAEIRKNQSARQVVLQQIVAFENRINFLTGRFPQHVDRISDGFLEMEPPILSAGMPAYLLANRADIRQAERELRAAGLDVLSARARFFPTLDLVGDIGWESYEPKFLFDVDALAGHIVGGFVQPLLNKKAIQAEYLGANARQLQALYNYQRTILSAVTDVVTYLAKAENYRRSVEFRKQQLASLETASEVASRLFQTGRVEYIELLLAQRDLLEAKNELIETKQELFSAVVQAYQALGGGYVISSSTPVPNPPGLNDSSSTSPAPTPLSAASSTRQESPLQSTASSSSAPEPTISVARPIQEGTLPAMPSPPADLQLH